MLINHPDPSRTPTPADGLSPDSWSPEDEAIDAFLAAAPQLEAEVAAPSARQERRGRRRDARADRKLARKTARSNKKAGRKRRRRKATGDHAQSMTAPPDVGVNDAGDEVDNERTKGRKVRAREKKAQAKDRKGRAREKKAQAKIAARQTRESAKEAGTHHRHDKRRQARQTRSRARSMKSLRVRASRASSRVSVRVIAAVALAVLVVGAFVWQERRLSDLEGGAADTVEAAADAVRGASGTRSFPLTTTDGSRLSVTVAVDGQAFLDASQLPTLPEGYTYQLWGATPSHRVSLAVLGGAPEVEAFLLPAAVGSMAVTVEVAGGVSASTTPSVAFGSVQPRS